MDIRRLITTVDTHTAGEPTRIITAGLPPLPGATMAEKRDFFKTHLDDVRLWLTQEPRGHSAMHVAVLTPPTQPQADAAALNYQAGASIAARLHPGKLTVPRTMFLELPFGAAVLKGQNAEFLTRLNAGLSAIRADGTFERINKSWMEQ